MKLRPVADANGQLHGYSFYCPGCKHRHVYFVTGALTWDFNGDVAAPSFTPSLLNTCDSHPDPTQRRCHLFLTAGKLNYCSDCTHALAGQTIDLPEIETE